MLSAIKANTEKQKMIQKTTEKEEPIIPKKSMPSFANQSQSQVVINTSINRESEVEDDDGLVCESDMRRDLRDALEQVEQLQRDN